VAGGSGVTGTVGDTGTVEVNASADLMFVPAVRTAVAVTGAVGPSNAAGWITVTVAVMPAVGDIAVVVASAMI
jgi:hypothetical protein